MHNVSIQNCSFVYQVAENQRKVIQWVDKSRCDGTVSITIFDSEIIS